MDEILSERLTRVGPVASMALGSRQSGDSTAAAVRPPQRQQWHLQRAQQLPSCRPRCNGECSEPSASRRRHARGHRVPQPRLAAREHETRYGGCPRKRMRRMWLRPSPSKSQHRRRLRETDAATARASGESDSGRCKMVALVSQSKPAAVQMTPTAKEERRCIAQESSTTPLRCSRLRPLGYRPSAMMSSWQQMAWQQ